jgi:hypothetical protein
MNIKDHGIVTFKVCTGTNLLNRFSKVSLRLFMIDNEPGELYIKDNLIEAILNEDSPREVVIITYRINEENQPKKNISLAWTPTDIKLYIDGKMVHELDPANLQF